MNAFELNAKVNLFEKQLHQVQESLHEEDLKQRLEVLQQATLEPLFWQDQKQAQKVFAEQNEIKDQLSQFHHIQALLETLHVVLELANLDEEIDETETIHLLDQIEHHIDDLMTKILLNQPYDKLNAIVDFHPGAGGTESQDWAEMLYRMITRYAERKDFKVQVLDYQVGEEAGIKSVTILVQGLYAYGYLKSEHGVHRLVRLSPFDASGRRHTSFASISVVPELDDSIEVEINEVDLRIDTYRSGGNGGQGVNTTDSAVRITHLPTKIVVTCQNERSQIQNRETALRILKGKLYQLELEKRQQEAAVFANSKMANAFGSQIRSYVFHPYAMVKDHRTDYETSNTTRVMDGDLDPFIHAYLRESNRPKDE